MAVKSRYKFWYLLFKCFSRTKPINSLPTPNKVLFLCHPGVGDLILTTPVFFNFKQKYPTANIDVVVGKHGSEILANNPHINRRFYRLSRQFKLSEISFVKKIRQQNYDYIIDLCDWASPPRLLKINLFAGKCCLRLRHAEIEAKRGAAETWHTYDFVIDADHQQHFSRYQSSILSFFDIKPANTEYSVYLEDSETQQRIKALEPTQPFIFVNVAGSRLNNSLCYQQTHFILTTLTNQYPSAKIIFDAFNVRWYKDHKLQLKTDFPNVEFNSTLSLAAVTEWIRHADLLIGTDSGTTHIATSCGTKQIIFSSKSDDIVQYFLPPYGEFKHLRLEDNCIDDLQNLSETLQQVFVAKKIPANVR